MKKFLLVISGMLGISLSEAALKEERPPVPSVRSVQDSSSSPERLRGALIEAGVWDKMLEFKGDMSKLREHAPVAAARISEIFAPYLR